MSQRQPEQDPWFYRPLVLIAVIFTALTITDLVEQFADRPPTHFTQGASK